LYFVKVEFLRGGGLDQRFRQPAFLRGHLGTNHLLLERRGLLDLISIAQEVEGQQAGGRANQGQLLAAGEHHLGHSVALLSRHHLLQHGVRLLGDAAVGNQVIGAAAVVCRIERLRMNKHINIDRLVILGAKLVHLFRIDDHVLPLGDLIAGDNLVVGYLAVTFRISVSAALLLCAFWRKRNSIFALPRSGSETVTAE
jgi:hypothetical protein